MTNVMRLIITVVIVIFTHEFCVVELTSWLLGAGENPEEEETEYPLLPYFGAKVLTILVAILSWRLMGGAWT